MRAFAMVVPLIFAVGCARPFESRPWVAHLELRGVHNVSARKLEHGLASRPTPTWQRGGVHLFDELELERDRTRVQRFYEMNGYYAAKIVLTEAKPMGPGGAVNVVIGVEEGPPTLIGDVKVFGIDGLDTKTRKQVQRYQLGLRRGQVFHHADYEQFKSDLTHVLAKRGFSRAVVEGEVDVSPTTNLADINLTFHANGVASANQQTQVMDSGAGAKQ
jgi:outer membrane protein assembly factor BamA